MQRNQKISGLYSCFREGVQNTQTRKVSAEPVTYLDAIIFINFLSDRLLDDYLQILKTPSDAVRISEVVLIQYYYVL